MNLPPTPPAEMIADIVRQNALPAAGAAAFVYAGLMLFSRCSASVAAAAAIIAAFVVANFQPVEHGEPLTWETTSRLIPWKPEKATLHQIPRATLVLVAVGLVSRWIGLALAFLLKGRLWWLPNLVVWLPRWVAVLVVGSWVIPPQLLESDAWVKPALAAAMLFIWIGADNTSRSGAGDQVMALLAACFLAGSVVFIFAAWKSAMDIAISLGFGFLGIAAVARVSKSDTSGAVPAAVAFLPALALNVKFQSVSAVPLAAYWLLALAPLGMLPFLIPRVSRQNRWLVGTLRALAVLVPLAIAVILAMENEELPPVESW